MSVSDFYTFLHYEMVPMVVIRPFADAEGYLVIRCFRSFAKSDGNSRSPIEFPAVGWHAGGSEGEDRDSLLQEW